MNRLSNRTSCALQAVALLCVGTSVFAATDWFGQARKNHIDFGVASRIYERLPSNRQNQPYVLLTAGRGGPLINPRPVELPEGEVLLSVHRSLERAGYPAAMSIADAELAIVVVYGVGEYPPPFDFMGVDPLAVPSFRWPTLLQQFEQRYFRRDYSEAQGLGIVIRRAAAESDLSNFIAFAPSTPGNCAKTNAGCCAGRRV